MSQSPVSPPPSYEELAAENAELKSVLTQALTRIAELEARLGTTSKNSGKPPSSDGLAKPAPKSLRKKSGRGPGRPKGQPGTTLRQGEDPDHEVTHEPGVCCGCGAGLDDADLAGVERRQVFDLPPLHLEVTEHRLVAPLRLRGGDQGRRAGRGGRAGAVRAPPGRDGRLSAARAVPVDLPHGGGAGGPVRSGRGGWDRGGLDPPDRQSRCRDPRRGTGPAAHGTGGPLRRDRPAGGRQAALDALGLCRHRRAADRASPPGNQGHGRRRGPARLHRRRRPRCLGPLRHVQAGHPRAVQRARGARAGLRHRHRPRGGGGVGRAGDRRHGRRQGPAGRGPRQRQHPGRQGHRRPAAPAAQQRLLRSALVLARTATKARATKLERKRHALFDRLLTRWDDYQRCVSDLAVPWDNNPAEQTIRIPKLRTKVSGCLRTLTGAEKFAAIRSYITTTVRNGQNMLDALIQAADGHPWIHAT